MTGRIVCLDPGKARIGVAVSDELGLTAQRKDPVDARGDYLTDVQRLASEYSPSLILVGYPLRTDGTAGPGADRSRSIADAVCARTGVATLLWDERFSTKEAQRILQYGNMDTRRQKDVIDGMSAQIILQSYLDAQASREAAKKNGRAVFTGLKRGRIMDDKIKLVNDDGEEVEFTIDDMFSFEEKTYVVLCENEDSEDALLFRIEETDGENGDDVLLIEVDDDEEFERVSDFYFNEE